MREGDASSDRFDLDRDRSRQPDRQIFENGINNFSFSNFAYLSGGAAFAYSRLSVYGKLAATSLSMSI